MTTLLVSLLSTLFDVRIGIALAFSMMIMAVSSLLYLLFATRRSSKPLIEQTSLSGFKLSEVKLVLRKPRMSLGTPVRVLSVQTFGYSQTTAELPVQDVIQLSFVPRLAGRFKGLTLTLEFNDPLRLFTKVAEVAYADFVLDVLPLSLLAPVSKPRASILTLGDAPAGSPGVGQELYAVEDYQPSAETKNIIWKRVARSPDENLFVRVREANIPEVVKVGLIERVDRGSGRFVWMDLFCEGLGTIGKDLIGIVSTVEILFASDEGPVSKSVTSEEELARVMMEFSAARPGSEGTDQVLAQSDIIVTGLREVEDPRLARWVARRPSLLISESASPALIGEHSIVFSGKENLSSIIIKALER